MSISDEYSMDIQLLIQTNSSSGINTITQTINEDIPLMSRKIVCQKHVGGCFLTTYSPGLFFVKRKCFMFKSQHRARESDRDRYRKRER